MTSKSFMQATQLENSDLITLQKCHYKKENSSLKKTQLEARIRIAQLEAQNAMQGVQKEIEESGKEYETALATICTKYGVDLKVDKLNLEGLITRAAPSPPVEEVQQLTSEEEDEDEDSEIMEGDEEEEEEFDEEQQND